MEIFKLFGSIFIDSAAAEDSIHKTEKKAESLGDKLGNGIKTAGKWGLALAGAAMAAGAAVMGAANKIAAATDEIDKASRRAGTDAETWQKLDYAMGQSGISSEKFEKTMVKNQKTLNEAASGGKAAAAAYADLGVAIRDSNGNVRDADAVYQDALKSLADMTDINERNRLANELFGKSYSDLAPILDGGSEGISELTSRAEQLGLVLSQETVDAGVKFGDTMDDLKQVGGALFNMVAAELLPVLQKFLDWIIAAAPSIRETVGGVAEFVSNVMSGIAKFWDENAEEIKAITDMLFAVLKTIFEAGLKVIKGVFDVFVSLFTGDWDKFWQGIVGIVEGIGDLLYAAGSAIFGRLWDGIKEVWEGIASWVSDKMTWLIDKITFWDNSKSKMDSSDGSHAAGLPYVPFDGYKAVLHKGETVMSAGSSKSMVEDIVNGLSTVLGSGGAGGNYQINLVVDGEKLASVAFDPLQRVAKQKGVAFSG